MATQDPWEVLMEEIVLMVLDKKEEMAVNLVDSTELLEEDEVVATDH